MNLNISLPDSDAEFVREKVASGRFRSDSDVVREALRIMQVAEREEAEKLTWLREAWRDGIGSGEAAPIDFAALKAEARARLASQKPGA
jgi:antitoxin ParD1/3/4